MIPDSIEWLLAARLLKKAQHFVGLKPLPTYDFHKIGFASPALTLDVLQRIRQAAPQWAPEYLDLVERLARLHHADPDISTSADDQIVQWTRRAAVDKVPVILHLPLLTEDVPWYRRWFSPFSNVPGSAWTDKYQTLTSWIQQLSHLSHSPPLDNLNPSSQPNVSRLLHHVINKLYRGITIDAPLLTPSGVRPRPIPTIGAKVDARLTETLLHEFGHLLAPLVNATPVVGTSIRLNPEVLNAAIVHVMLGQAVKEIADQGATPFTAQELGRMVRRMAENHKSYMQRLRRHASSSGPLAVTPDAEKLALSTISQPDPESGPWWEMFQAYRQQTSPPIEDPQVARERAELANKLSYLLGVAAATDKYLPPEKFNLAHVFASLARLAKAKLSPSEEKLYQIATYGPKTPEDLDLLLTRVAERVPEITKTPPFKEVQRLLSRQSKHLKAMLSFPETSKSTK